MFAHIAFDRLPGLLRVITNNQIIAHVVETRQYGLFQINKVFVQLDGNLVVMIYVCVANTKLKPGNYYCSTAFAIMMDFVGNIINFLTKYYPRCLKQKL